MPLKILGVVADLVTVLSVWDVNGKIPIWVKILCTVFLFLVAVIVGIKDRYIAKVIDYMWEEDTLLTLFVKKNAYFNDNALVSIYMKEDNKKTLAAIGFVMNEGENIQIRVFKFINNNAMCRIKTNKKSYKKFFVKPNVCYYDIYDIGFL